MWYRQEYSITGTKGHNTLQALMDWADDGDLQKNLDGVIHCDDD